VEEESSCYGNQCRIFTGTLSRAYDTEPDHLNQPWLHASEFKQHETDAHRRKKSRSKFGVISDALRFCSRLHCASRPVHTTHHPDQKSDEKHISPLD
jgi:hypothetical protein